MILVWFLRFMTWNPFFLISSNVFGKCNWFNSLKPNLSKVHFSGNCLFFPSDDIVIKIACSYYFTGLITSGSIGLEPYILHSDLASGPQTHTCNFLIETGALHLVGLELYSWVPCSPSPNTLALLWYPPSSGWHYCIPNCPGHNVKVILDSSFFLTYLIHSKSSQFLLLDYFFESSYSSLCSPNCLPLALHRGLQNPPILSPFPALSLRSVLLIVIK